MITMGGDQQNIGRLWYTVFRGWPPSAALRACRFAPALQPVQPISYLLLSSFLQKTSYIFLWLFFITTASFITFAIMIAYLKGNFTNINPSTVIIDVSGIGYEVNISLNTYTHIQNQKQGLLYTHLLIKEDAHLLYGFADVKEKDIFLALLSVSGIGANTARLILSYMKPDEVATAILHGDSRALERIKGIGKKTAERAVLELKDKMGKQSADVILPAGNTGSARQDALEALLALGISKPQAEQSIYKILQAEPDIALEALIKKVLKGL